MSISIKNFEDLSDCSKEHICNCIKDGYNQGQICEYFYDEVNDEEVELLGWWSIGNGRIEAFAK